METLLQQAKSEKYNFISAFVESRIGGRSENQDSYGWSDTQFGYVMTVCDGMGGGPGGRTASTIAVKEIITGIKEGLEDANLRNIIIKAFQKANMAIIKAADEYPQLKGMGSTATVLLINNHSAWVAHVGDSRIYQLRNKKKVFRTFDHSLVFDMVQRGVITEEQARLSADSNIITRALGIKQDVEVEVAELPFLKGDRFVMTSDGIHGAMPEMELVKKCSESIPVGAVVDDIATHVDNIGKGKDNNHDNLTIAIIETNKKSKLKTKMSKQIKVIIVSLCCICVVSIGFNISQYHSTTQNADSFVKLQQVDSIQKKEIDSLMNVCDSLQKLPNRVNEK